MDAILNLAKKATALDIDFILARIWANTDLQKKILDLNRIGQLYDKGINADGIKLSDVGGNYSPVTLDLSQLKGKPKRGADHIDLHDTGDFYASFVIYLDNDGFTIDANPIKDDTNLFTEWGDNILGLTDESLEIVGGFIKEAIAPKIIEYLLN